MTDDEGDDELVFSDAELVAIENDLFAAIRESHKLDAEIDDELRRLVHPNYDGPRRGRRS